MCLHHVRLRVCLHDDYMMTTSCAHVDYIMCTRGLHDVHTSSPLCTRSWAENRAKVAESKGSAEQSKGSAEQR